MLFRRLLKLSVQIMTMTWYFYCSCIS